MDECSISCPYCGEIIDVLIDSSVSGQEYYEDCSVCCSPILFYISVDQQNKINVIAKRDDE